MAIYIIKMLIPFFLIFNYRVNIFGELLTLKSGKLIHLIFSYLFSAFQPENQHCCHRHLLLSNFEPAEIFNSCLTPKEAITPIKDLLDYYFSMDRKRSHNYE